MMPGDFDFSRIAIDPKKIEKVLKSLRVPYSAEYRPEINKIWPKIQKLLAPKLLYKNLELWKLIWNYGIANEYINGVKLAGYRELINHPGIIREAAEDYFENHGLELVKDLTETDLKTLKTQMCKNWGVGEDAFERIVRDDFIMAPYRIKHIYRTEHHRAQNAGVLNVSKRIGRRYKQWICLVDERACEICGSMSDKVVPIDKPFKFVNKDGEVVECDIPNDSHPNCRCAMITLTEEDLTDDMRQQLIDDGYLDEEDVEEEEPEAETVFVPPENPDEEGEFWTPRMDYPVKTNAAFADIGSVIIDSLVTEPSPSNFLKKMNESGVLAAVLPTVAAMAYVNQSPAYYPEDSTTVWEHTMLALEFIPEGARTPSLMLATLLHDIGKVYAVSHDGLFFYHDMIGADRATDILKNITDDESLIEDVVLLIRYHMWMHNFDAADDISKRIIMSRFMAAGVNISELITLHEVDLLARGVDPLLVEHLSEEADRVYDEVGELISVEPIILEVHLENAGIEPGPARDQLLRELYERQLNGEFFTVDEGLELLRDIYDGNNIEVAPDTIQLIDLYQV